MAKKSRVKTAFEGSNRPTPKQAEHAAEKVTRSEKKIGRPKATHGLTRTSVLADSKKMKRLKVEAAKQGRNMYELLNEALGEYLDKYE